MVCGSTATQQSCVLGGTGAGTYTVRVRDNSNTATGNYSLYIQRLNNPLGCAPLTIAGPPTSASIAAATEADCFTFSGTSGDLLRLLAVETAGTMQLELEVLRPDGTTRCISSLSNFSCTLDTPGTHTVLAYDTLENRLGDYTFSLYRLNNPLGCAPLTIAGPPTSASIAAATEADCFTFSGTSGDLLRLLAVETAGTMQLELEVLRPDGTTRCISSSSNFSCTLDAPGIHTVLAYDVLESRLGDYAFSLYRLNNPVGCVALAYGAPPIPGSIDLAEQDCYRFTGAAGDVARVAVSETAGALNTYTEVFRSNGTSLCPATNARLFACALDASGDHTIVISDLGGTDTGTYGVSIQKVNSPNTCTGISSNTPPLAASIDLAAEQDCYRFSGAAGDVARVAVSETAGALNTYTEVFRSNGTSLCPATNARLIACTLDASGDHTIVISDLGGTDNGTYGISLQKVNSPNTCGAIGFNLPPLTGSIDMAAEQDCYSFSGAPPDVARIAIGETSGSLTTYTEVFRPDGTSLCGPTNGSLFSCTLDAPGPHTIVVSDLGNTDSGTYNLALQNLLPVIFSCPIGSSQPIALLSDQPAQCDVIVPADTPNLFVTLRKDTAWNGSVEITKDGVPLVSKSGSGDMALQLVTPQAGTYVVNLTGAGTGVLSVAGSLPALTLGEWATGTILRRGGNAWYQVDIPPGPTELCLALETLGLWSRLEVRFGGLAGSPVWSATGDRASLCIPSPAAGRYYVSIWDSAWIPGGNQHRDHLIRADVTPIVFPDLDPVITSFSPTTGGTAGPVTVTIHGAGLDPGASVRLWSESALDLFVDPESASGSSDGRILVATFDFSSVLPGSYKLVVSNSAGKQATADERLTVQNGGAGGLWVDIRGREVIRAGANRWNSYTLTFGNDGNIDLDEEHIIVISWPKDGDLVVVGGTGAYGNPPPPALVDGFREAAAILIARVPAHSSQSINVSFTNPSVGELTLKAAILPLRALNELQPAHAQAAMATQTFSPALLTAIDDNNPPVGSSVFVGPDLRAGHPNPLGHQAVIGEGTQPGSKVVLDPFVPGPGGEPPSLEQWKNALGVGQPFGPRYLGAATPPGWTTTIGSQAADKAREMIAAAAVLPDWRGGKNAGQDGYYSCAGLAEYVYEFAGLNPNQGPTIDPWALQPGMNYRAWTGRSDYYLPYPLSMMDQYGLLPISDFVEDLGGLLGLALTLREKLLLAVSSISPEDKFGPTGYDPPDTPPAERQRFVRADTQFNYRVDFWNKEDAPAPTQDVYITDQLDTDLDWSTLSFTEIGFLKWKVSLEGGQYFNVDVDLRPDVDLIINAEGSFDPWTREIRWEFHSLDPLTREPPEDPFAGFLPPITASGYEIGWVNFTVDPLPGLAVGTRIENQALVKFDVDVFKPAPPGGPYVNTIDADSDNDFVVDMEDNCDLVTNPGQEHSDGNFIDQTPPSTQDDRTWPNSDPAGDACDTDDDNDGILDVDEAAGCNASGPLLATNRDTDGDRFLDGAECAVGTNPASAASKPTIAQCAAFLGVASTLDTDGDR
ncbi:MAG: hypothetical protein HY873_02620, partial [Chloroflexi bacterium]|nr:hypothetical protein [Chloroflexota bacterium]